MKTLWHRELATLLMVQGLLLVCSCGSIAVAEDQPQPVPTWANVKYGPHERNVIDLWIADRPGARPLLVYIHGGGWLTGDKSQKGPKIQPFLDQGISFAAFNYRLTPENPLPAPVHDAARAIQFLRSKATDWKINPQRIALTGPSAGACTSMWLLLHDDMANPHSPDPVERESSRVCAASVQVGQTSIDPKVISDWLGPNVLQHPMIASSVGEKDMDGVLRRYSEFHDLFAEFSPINHVDSQDPPLFMTCSAEMDLPSRDAGHGIHHPVFGVELKKKSDAAGHECHLVIPGVAASAAYPDGTAFLLKMLLKSD